MNEYDFLNYFFLHTQFFDVHKKKARGGEGHQPPPAAPGGGGSPQCRTKKKKKITPCVFKKTREGELPWVKASNTV